MYLEHDLTCSRAKGAQIPTDRTWRSSTPPVAVAYALPRLLGLEMWLLASGIQIDEEDSRIYQNLIQRHATQQKQVPELRSKSKFRVAFSMHEILLSHGLSKR